MKRIILISLLTLICINTFSQDYAIIIKRRMALGNLEYSFNTDGINMCLNDIRAKDLDLYNSLNSVVQEINSKQITANIIGIGGTSIGAAALVTGIVITGVTYPWWENESLHTTGLIVMGSGAGVAMISFLLGFMVLPPNENDFYKFVNRYNSLNNENPIKIILNGNGLTLIVKL